jgi:hypothetical protein
LEFAELFKIHNSESASIEPPGAKRKIRRKSPGFPETSWRFGGSSGRTVPLSGPIPISRASRRHRNSLILLGERDVEVCG